MGSNEKKNFYQMSNAEYQSQQLYRMAQDGAMPHFLYHPDIPYGTLTKEQLENANFPDDNELSIEQFRNGYPPEYYNITGLSQENYQKMKEEQIKIEDQDWKETEYPLNFNQDSTTEKQISSTEPFSELVQNPILQENKQKQPIVSSKPGRKGRNTRASKKAKIEQEKKPYTKKRNMNLKK